MRNDTRRNYNLKKTGRQDLFYGYLFIAPVMLGYIIFMLGPIIAAFGMSFTNSSLIQNVSEFIGLQNYKDIFFQDPYFYKIFLNTIYFSAGLVPLNIVIAMGLALLLTMKLKGIGFFRTAIFTPVVTSVVVWSILWKFIFGTEGGLINMVLKMIGVTGPAWLYNMNLAMPVVILVSVIKNVGVNMVIFISALTGVPKMYYEASRIDGANSFQIFRKITLPMISPIILMVSVITVIGSLKVFSQIFVMTQGGPANSTKVLMYYIYEMAFKHYEFGYATAMAVILFLMILILTLLQWNLRKRWVYNED